jgi:uncharacterized protein
VRRDERRGRRARRLAAIACCACALLVTVNARALALQSIHAYQRALAPAAARIGLRCRFTPTCSRYAETVIARDGALRGGAKALRRIARCGPWTAPGTRDEP